MDKQRISSGSGCYDYHTVIAAASSTTTTTTRNHYTPHPAHTPLAPTQHAQSQFTPQTHHSHSHCRYGGNRTRLQQTINNSAAAAAAASSPIALGGHKSNPKLFHGMNPNGLPIIGIHSWQSARHDEQLAANVAAIAAARSRQQMTAAAIAAATATTTTPGGNLHKQQQHNNSNNNNNYINSGSNGKLQQQKPALPTMPTMEGTGTTTIPSAFRTKPRNKSEEAISDLLQRIPDIGHIFDVHSRIGNGTFSTVLLATLRRESHLPDSMRRKFAIKHHIPTSHPDRIMKELQCMTDMGGTDNVVGIHCCLRCEASAAFVMPYMPHDRFHDFYTKMDVPEIRLYMRNLLLALRHVHRFNIIHRDVKPSNFLYNRRQGQFLLVDFGLAQHVNISNTSQSQSQQQQQPSNLAKRPREREPASNAPAEAADQQQQQQRVTQSASDIALGGAVKRMRLNDDQQTTSGSWNKMPLKPVNEITSSGRLAEDSGGKQTELSEAQSQSIPAAMQQPPAPAPTTPLPPDQTGAGAGAGSSSIKYNTNRMAAGGGNNSKCFCFANPSVCINCLMKKEVHASRAGTPGYRPPEVLLKYADQTTAVDVWAAGVIFLSVLSSVYPFFKAPNDFVALAEIVTIFGDRAIRKTALALERMVTISQRSKPLNLRKLCLRFRHRLIFSDPQMIRKHESPDGRCDVCKNCDQYFFNCLCEESDYVTEPLDPYECFPASAYDLLGRLLEINPHKRITAEEALNHPFFTEPPLPCAGAGSAVDDDVAVAFRKGRNLIETPASKQNTTTTRRRAAKEAAGMGMDVAAAIEAGVPCASVEQLNLL